MDNKESEILEYKLSFGEWKEIIITLGAFANKQGGMIIVGLNDDGGYVDFHIGTGAIEDIDTRFFDSAPYDIKNLTEKLEKISYNYNPPYSIQCSFI